MIICPAVKIYPKDSDYPIIVTGINYENIYKKIKEMNIDYDVPSLVSGFFNDKDYFLDRFAAKYEARVCNQLIYDTNDRALYEKDLK